MTEKLTEEQRILAFENYDECMSCGNKYQEGDICHLGFDENNEPLYVCEECSNKLKKTTVRYVHSPRPYEIPPPENKLWRYTDFTKYVSMLTTNGLFFNRADFFQDTFEGAKGLKKKEGKWDAYYLNFLRKAIRSAPKGQDLNSSDEEVEKQAKRLLKDLKRNGENIKKRTFINCWHENEHESEAMWRLYSSYIDYAIAVRTSYNSLYHALGRNPSINIGRVNYIDFENNFAGVNDSFWHKRKSFEHEREVRAIIVNFNITDKGIIAPCDLSLLIEEVYISPSAPGWFTKLVNDVNEKFGIKAKVSPSKINQKPFF